MKYFNKFLVTIFLLSTYTSFIHAMEHQDTMDIEGFERCKSFMINTFQMSLDRPIIDFVKYAIKKLRVYFSFEKQWQTMGYGVQNYFLSFYKELSAENIQLQEEFCDEMSTNPSKIEQMTRNLYIVAEFSQPKDVEKAIRYQLADTNLKKKDCLYHLNKFGESKQEILKSALYSFNQGQNSEYEDFVKNLKYKCDTYEYYYLDDIAERVKIVGNLVDPLHYCRQKHKNKSDTEASTSKSANEAGPSK